MQSSQAKGPVMGPAGFQETPARVGPARNGLHVSSRQGDGKPVNHQLGQSGKIGDLGGKGPPRKHGCEVKEAVFRKQLATDQRADRDILTGSTGAILNNTVCLLHQIFHMANWWGLKHFLVIFVMLSSCKLGTFLSFIFVVLLSKSI